MGRQSLIFPFFVVCMLILASLLPSSTSEQPLTQKHVKTSHYIIPDLPENDISVVDVWRGTANETHPMYWGNHMYFFTGDPIFFASRGGVHNHAASHTVWNEPVYIIKITNCEFDGSRVIVHNNETYVKLSNGTEMWIPNMVCPVCNASMHISEFSLYSMAVYWYCHECRLFIGEIL